MSQDRSVVSEALDIAQLKLMSGVVRSFLSNPRRFTQIQLCATGLNFVGPDDNLYLALRWTVAIRRGAGGSHQKRAPFDMIRTY